MKKIIVFDLDDTLYKEIDFLKSAYREIAAYVERVYNKQDIYEFMMTCYEGGKNSFECLLNYYSLPIDIELLLKMYRNHFPDIFLSDDTKFILQYFVDSGYILGLITDGREQTQLNKITALNLQQYIPYENCIISEAFGFSKPSLEAYLFFQNKYGEGTYSYVGDNVSKDFIAPNRLNWRSFCLKDDGQNIHKQIFVEGFYKPKYVITSLGSLKDLI